MLWGRQSPTAALREPTECEVGVDLSAWHVVKKMICFSRVQTYFSQQGQGVVFHKRLVAVLIYCVCAELFQSEATCKRDARIADIILHTNIRSMQHMSSHVILFHVLNTCPRKSAQACATITETTCLAYHEQARQEHLAMLLWWTDLISNVHVCD